MRLSERIGCRLMAVNTEKHLTSSMLYLWVHSWTVDVRCDDFRSQANEQQICARWSFVVELFRRVNSSLNQNLMHLKRSYVEIAKGRSSVSASHQNKPACPPHLPFPLALHPSASYLTYKHVSGISQQEN